MARREASEFPDPFENDDLFDDPLETPLTDLDDIRIDEIEDDDPEAAQWRRTATRAPLSVGQVLGGIIQVVLVGALALALFLALGAGAILIGQRVGIVPARGAANAASVAALPTQAVLSAPTAASVEQPTDVPAVLPSATPDGNCPTAPAWWNSQQVQDNYAYFTERALNEARGSDRIAALLEQMRIRRNFVGNLAAFPCVEAARDTLLRGFDAIIEAARALNAGDLATVSQQRANANQAFAELTAQLWQMSVIGDPNTPTALGIARNSGASCGAQAWYAAVKLPHDAFFSAASQIDPTSTSAADARARLDTMALERGNAAAVETPQCAAQAQAHLLAALESEHRSIEQRLAGNADAAAVPLNHEYRLFLAWVEWLGVS